MNLSGVFGLTYSVLPFVLLLPKSIFGKDTKSHCDHQDDNCAMKRTSLDIDNSLNSLHQDDPRLIEIIKNHYLYPPVYKDYGFSRKNPALEGQFRQASYIANTFFGVRLDVCAI